MNKVIVVATLSVLLLATVACQRQEQKQQKQQQLNYLPATSPALLPVDQLKQAAQREPKNAQAWINLGNTLMDAQRFGDAVDAYEKALALDPKNVPVLVDLGTCYRGIGRSDKAVEHYRKALRVDPSFPNGHRNLGVVLGFDMNKRAEAIQEFKRYLELVPNGPDADSARKAIQELNSGK